MRNAATVRARKERTPLVVGLQLAFEIRPGVQKGHNGARNSAAGWVDHSPFNRPGIRLRLRVQHGVDLPGERELPWLGLTGGFCHEMQMARR